MKAQEHPSLYDRLGGIYNIAPVIDDFIDRIMDDARLNKTLALDEAYYQLSPPAFKYLVTEMVCWATGGPQRYSGRSMGDVHRHLGITEDEWAAFMDDLRRSLAKFRIPAEEGNDLVTIIESIKDSIVVVVVAPPPLSRPANQ